MILKLPLSLSSLVLYSVLNLQLHILCDYTFCSLKFTYHESDIIHGLPV